MQEFTLFLRTHVEHLLLEFCAQNDEIGALLGSDIFDGPGARGFLGQPGLVHIGGIDQFFIT